MLAVLGGALRLDLILTTNFDNLLERAFEVARNPLLVSEVQLDDALPHWSTLGDGRTLIKLHGNRSAVRADYSLDQEPSQEDKERFVEYLLSAKGRHQAQSGEPAPEFQNHLLVIGVSGRDRRIRSLIKYAVGRLPDPFQVFWICYSVPDLQSIELYKASLTRPQALKVLRHPESGLFLLHLYQSIRRSLPPLGAIFPSVPRQTLPPLESQAWTAKLAKQQPELKDFVARLLNAIGGDHDGKPIHVVSHPAAGAVPKPTSGVTSACARAFRLLESDSERTCLWIDMNDISSADNLYEVVLEAVYYRLGLEDWIPTTSGLPQTVDARDQRRGDEIRRLVKSINRQWVLFLNARERPGANTERGLSQHDDWISRKDPDSLDASSNHDAFLSLLRALCKAESMRVVVMSRDPKLFSKGPNDRRIHGVREVALEDTEAQTWSFDAAEVVGHAITWADGGAGRMRFLHALTLMQRPRLLATIWSQALSKPPVDRDKLLEWIEDLEGFGLVRRKPGGFIWLHANSRQMLREAFQWGRRPLGGDVRSEPHPNLERLLKLEQGKVGEILKKWQAGAVPGDVHPPPATGKRKELAADIHEALAAWYARLLDASDSPSAAFEAAYHYCEAADSHLRADAHVEAIACFDAAAAILKANSYLIQTHGYSRGSCRRLEFTAEIASDILKHATHLDGDVYEQIAVSVRRLWIVCAEVMRAIARELGEERKAFLRHRQVGRMIAGDTWDMVKAHLFERQSTDDGEQRPRLRDRVLTAVVERSGGKLAQEYATLRATAEGVEPSESSASSEPSGPDAATIASFQRRKRRELEDSKSDKSRCSPDSELIRWWRWTGMLALNSRSYGLSREFLEMAIGPFGDLSPEQKWRLETQTQRVEILRAIEQAVQLNLLVANLLQRSNEGGGDRLMAEAGALIRRGAQLARKIRGSDRSGDAHFVVQANWCETRLLMHKSVVVTADAHSGCFVEALGILGEAEAMLRMSDWRRSRSELAMLDLHRAEVRRREVDALVAVGEDPRKISALITDCIRFLDRAEPVLRERRRNVWWTTWYFERKLRAIASSIRSAAEDSPIPFLGLESAMRLTDTEADRLLMDGKRMIRVDSYRLATIVDAYHECYEQLCERAILLERRKRDTLPNRRKCMHGLLKDGLTAMKEVHAGRTSGTEEFKNNGALDPLVTRYVKTVIDRIAKTVEG
jgi:hypothetical protein